MPVVVATRASFRGRDAAAKRGGGWCAGREAGALCPADLARGRQLVGVPTGRDQPQDRESVAIPAIGPEFRRGSLRSIRR
jgi:hypothetical protein